MRKLLLKCLWEHSFGIIPQDIWTNTQSITQQRAQGVVAFKLIIKNAVDVDLL